LEHEKSFTSFFKLNNNALLTLKKEEETKLEAERIKKEEEAKLETERIKKDEEA
jgi:hypothetical protein